MKTINFYRKRVAKELGVTQVLRWALLIAIFPSIALAIGGKVWTSLLLLIFVVLIYITLWGFISFIWIKAKARKLGFRSLSHMIGSYVQKHESMTDTEIANDRDRQKKISGEYWEKHFWHAVKLIGVPLLLVAFDMLFQDMTLKMIIGYFLGILLIFDVKFLWDMERNYGPWENKYGLSYYLDTNRFPPID